MIKAMAQSTQFVRSFIRRPDRTRERATGGRTATTETVELNSRAINRDSRYARQMNKFVLLVSSGRIPFNHRCGPGPRERLPISRPRH